MKFVYCVGHDSCRLYGSEQVVRDMGLPVSLTPTLLAPLALAPLVALGWFLLLLSMARAKGWAVSSTPSTVGAHLQQNSASTTAAQHSVIHGSTAAEQQITCG